MMMIVWCLMRTFKVELMFFFIYCHTNTQQHLIEVWTEKTLAVFLRSFFDISQIFAKKSKHENIISTKTMRDSAFLCKIRLFNQLNQPVIRARKWIKTIAYLIWNFPLFFCKNNFHSKMCLTRKSIFENLKFWVVRSNVTEHTSTIKSFSELDKEKIFFTLSNSSSQVSFNNSISTTTKEKLLRNLSYMVKEWQSPFTWKFVHSKENRYFFFS